MTNKLKIKSIDINNFKSIWREKDIDITGGIIPILGMNGAGKSNILKAIDWFRNGGYEESIDNFYRKDEENITRVNFNIGINLKGNKYSAFNSSNKEIIKEFLNNMLSATISNFSKLTTTLNTIGITEEYKKFIDEKLQEKEFSISKIRDKNENGEILDLYGIEGIPRLGIDENETNYLKYLVIISDYIQTFLINPHFPQIKLYNSSKTLNDFTSGKTEEGKLMDNEISFKTLFEGIPLKNDTMPNYKLIDNMIKSMNHEEIDSLSKFSVLASREYIGSGNIHETNKSEFKVTLKKFQELFSQCINENAFFKSINSNMTFMIYPTVEAGTEVKLTMFDVVEVEGKEPKPHILEDIHKKNDGFIFALLLFFEIEFSHNEESILLIDEPANFLSTPSIRLLMESFRRSKKQKKFKFIFTTHSSNTLDKNIVELEDILIAKKGKDHSTFVKKATDLEENSKELEIIFDEYKIPKKGIDIIVGDLNYLVSAEKAFEKDFYKIVETINAGNLIPLVDVKVLTNNLSSIKKMNNSFECGQLDKSFAGKIDIMDFFDNEEISNLVYDLNIMGGEAPKRKLELEEDYKILWITRILRHFENNISVLIEKMPKTMEKIKEKFGNE